MDEPFGPTATKSSMTDEETIERIRKLRVRGLSPNEIARNVGIRRALATKVIRALAAERGAVGDEDEGVDSEIRARMARSEFGGLLDPGQGGNVITLPAWATTHRQHT